MGNISSRPDDGSSLYMKDQTRFSIASLSITNGRRKVILNLTPNSFPATRYLARKEIGDDTPVVYVQDPEATGPAFILKLDQDAELDFHFSFMTRQTQAPASTSISNTAASTDTSISGLTFAFAPNTRELDTLVTREFHADPNLHKNSNVQLIGDYSTNGNPSVQFEWSWRWRPPKASEDKGGGWRNSCSFLEYDSRAHRLNTLASFSFWVNSKSLFTAVPLVSPGFELAVPTARNRMTSSQSYQSTMSDSEGPSDFPNPPSPSAAASDFSSSAPTATQQPAPVIDVTCQRPGEDFSAVEDGPVFRATMKSLEQKTGNMRVQMKKVLRKAEAAQQAQVDCNLAMKGFLSALQEAAVSNNSSAFKPALDHYFNNIARRILQYETENTEHLQKQIIEPLSKLYNLDIKQAESKKKDFEEESRDYYAYVSRYLGQRQDSLKEKKRAESDSKYQTKRRNFELKRFDYSSFMQDLHGGRKEQELLSQLTRYADSQAKSFLKAAKKVENLTPQLDALVQEVANADKEYKFQRTEREEKRRNLEKNAPSYTEPETVSHGTSDTISAPVQNSTGGYTSDNDLSRADSTSSQFGYTGSVSTLSPSNSILKHSANGAQPMSPGNASVTPNQNRFKGIRDLEQRDTSLAPLDRFNSNQQRKEGLLWALSKPNSHMDPVGINKQAWHKFWVVLDQGKLSEYSNWKDKLDLHREPIDLRVASVRTARDAERRFCFEVITPVPLIKRVYQATTEEEMNNWINAINNALQSAVEGRGAQTTPQSFKEAPDRTGGRDIGSILTGKSSSHSGPHSHQTPRNDAPSVNRRITVGARPSYIRTTSNTYDNNPTKLLDQVRAADVGNTFCADCNSTSRVDWVSLNLGIVLCIECSGIHRSLGTHISKIRSLTLDITSFTNDIVEMLMLIGNRVSNMVWEAKLDRAHKPTAQASRDQRLRFITAKYVERAYVNTITGAAAPDEILLTSIKKNDIQGVLNGIALSANVNAHDKSRGTHAVFLALTASDPAAPGTSPGTSPAVTPNAKTQQQSPQSAMVVKAFPIAELLVQNGAEIPAAMPAIPLSPASQLYIEQRTARRGAVSGSEMSSTVRGNGTADTLGPLPVRDGSGAFRGPVDRERENKLQKRGSAGARFAGKVTAGFVGGTGEK